MTDAELPQRHLRNSTPTPGRSSHLAPPADPGDPSDEPERHPAWNSQWRVKFVSGAALPLRRDHADAAAPLDATQALAQALRQQLTIPGSISPQLQLTLIMAARMVHQPDFDPPALAADHWTPFRQSADRNPHDPLSPSGDSVTDRHAAAPHAWWQWSPEAFSTTQ